MPTKRTVDLITEAFSDVMTSRRKYELKKPNGELLKELYFPPLTRFDRIQAQAASGTDEALAISTRLLCQIAQNEDGTKAFASADVPIETVAAPPSLLTVVTFNMTSMICELAGTVATTWSAAEAPIISKTADCAMTTEPTLDISVPTVVPVVSLIEPALTGPENVVVPIIPSLKEKLYHLGLSARSVDREVN